MACRQCSKCGKSASLTPHTPVLRAPAAGVQLPQLTCLPQLQPGIKNADQLQSDVNAWVSHHWGASCQPQPGLSTPCACSSSWSMDAMKVRIQQMVDRWAQQNDRTKEGLSSCWSEIREENHITAQSCSMAARASTHSAFCFMPKRVALTYAHCTSRTKPREVPRSQHEQELMQQPQCQHART